MQDFLLGSLFYGEEGDVYIFVKFITILGKSNFATKDLIQAIKSKL